LLNGHSFESPAQIFIASSSSKQQAAAAASSKQQQQKFTAIKQQQQKFTAIKQQQAAAKCPSISTCPQQAEVYIFNSRNQGLYLHLNSFC
jgi:hypothetical protein